VIDKPPPAVALVGGRRVWWTAVRRRSARVLVVMVPIVIASAWALTRISAHDWLKYLLAPPFTITYVVCMASLAGLVFGRPLRELDTAWNQMAGWRRGLPGLVSVRSRSCCSPVLAA
jgi:hypothetical protein